MKRKRSISYIVEASHIIISEMNEIRLKRREMQTDFHTSKKQLASWVWLAISPTWIADHRPFIEWRRLHWKGKFYEYGGFSLQPLFWWRFLGLWYLCTAAELSDKSSNFVLYLFFNSNLNLYFYLWCCKNSRRDKSGKRLNILSTPPCFQTKPEAGDG